MLPPKYAYPRLQIGTIVANNATYVLDGKFWKKGKLIGTVEAEIGVIGKQFYLVTFQAGTHKLSVGVLSYYFDRFDTLPEFLGSEYAR